MQIVRSKLDRPGGKPAAGAVVTVRLVASLTDKRAQGYTAAGEIVASRDVTVGRDGTWQLELVPNAQITPGNTVYVATAVIDSKPQTPQVFQVPDTPGPHQLRALIVGMPEDLEPLLAALLQQALADHAADGELHGGGPHAATHATGGPDEISPGSIGAAAADALQVLQELVDTKASHDDIAAAVAALVDASPELLDTLAELAAAIGDDPNFATTVAQMVANEAAARAAGDATTLADANTYTDSKVADEATARTAAIATATSLGSLEAKLDGTYRREDDPLAIADTTGLQGALDAKETPAGAQTKADAAQAHAVQRANHTGSQAISTVTGLQTALDGKQAAGNYVTGGVGVNFIVAVDEGDYPGSPTPGVLYVVFPDA